MTWTGRNDRKFLVSYFTLSENKGRHALCIEAMEEMLKSSNEDKFLAGAYEASKQFAMSQTRAA